MATITLKPSFFLIIVNQCNFQTKMSAVNFVKFIRPIFKEAMIKMVGTHQDHLVKTTAKFELKLWGIGRSNRAKVHKILSKYC